MNTDTCSQHPDRWKPTGLPVARAIVIVMAAAGLAFLLSSSQPALARATFSYSLIKTYPNPSPAVGEEFGNAVAWLPPGDKLIVGARSDLLGGATAIGAAYVLSATTGAITHVLTETGSVSADYFGYSIAVSGTLALIGAPNNSTGAPQAGSAFLYATNTGALVRAFHDPNPSANDNFGASVAILSDTAVLVGEPQYLTNVGRAYVCLVADGSCLTAINSPSGALGGFFGLSVAALGNKFAVGAPLDTTHGKVYVFTTTAVSSYNTIALTTTTAGDNFGRALSVVNGNLLIGAQNGGTSFSNTAGAAYLYTPQGTLLRSFYNPDSSDSSALFGAAVAGDGNLVLIGAPGAKVVANGEGRAYVFNATTGALISTFKKTSPAGGDHFGNAVAILGEDFLVGAPDDSTGASQAGAVYRFGVIAQSNLYLPLIRR
jgi:hypothetical protein